MRQLRSSDFRKKIDFSKNYLETLLAFYFSTGEERENISKERRDSLCFRFKRRRRKIYQIILPATPFLPPGLLASAPYFSLIRSILFCLGPRKPDSLSPPSPPSFLPLHLKCKFAWKGIHSKIWSRIRIPDKIPRLRYVNRHVSTERKSCVSVARAEPGTFERVEGKKGERERERERRKK